MKKVLLALILLTSLNGLAQEQVANWYFGQGAGIRFDIDTGVVTSVNDGQLNTLEGCTSISDENGDLLLYTDGSTVYNKNHQVMQNGTGLFGSSSATQSAIVIPAPKNTDLFYIFTVDTSVGDNTNYGLNYSIIDITLNGGLGAVTTKNTNLLAHCSEKITAVLKDCSSESIWVITFASADGSVNPFNTYHAFEVSTTGVNTTSVASTFPQISETLADNDYRGQLKVAPDGSSIASANMSGSLYFHDFNTDTGVVSNQLPLIINSNSASPYGVEFSPNSELLYIHSSNDTTYNGSASIHQSTLTQFNLQAADIQASEYTVDQRQLYRGSLQLGPNGKIYRALSANYLTGLPYLGVINNPNAIGAACDYQHDAVSLSPNLSTQGLPPFIQSIINNQIEIDIIQNSINNSELSLCVGETYTLSYDNIANATYNWYKDDVLLTESDFDLIITEPGNYKLIINTESITCDTLEGIVNVTYVEVPVANSINNVSICDDNNNDTWSFDFSILDTQVLATQSATTYSVQYFTSQADADNNQNAITGSYSNISSPQQIYTRIHNNANTSCYDTTSFYVEVFDSPAANSIADINICDDNNDATWSFDFSILDVQVLAEQNNAIFSVQYFTSQADADNNQNAITGNYNNISSPQQIYTRIHNNANTSCYDTTSFYVEVFDSPTANPIVDINICDDNNDATWSFDFSTLDVQVLAEQNNAIFSVQYFTSQADADNNVNPITGNYSNISSPQQIYTRIHNNANTGCYDTTSFFVTVFNSLIANSIADIIICDDNNDDTWYFDFSSLDAQVLAERSNTAFSVQYFTSQADADNNMNPITEYYSNINSPQQIYSRIHNNAYTNCFDTTSFSIAIYDNPIANPIADINICDDNNDATWSFDFSTLDTQVLAEQNNAIFSVQYFTSQADADNNVNPITGNYNNISSPQQIYTRIHNNANAGCYDTASFSIAVFDSPIANPIADINICDDNNDATWSFDFSTLDVQVLATQSATTFSVQYFTSQADADNNVNPIAGNYSNISSPQQIYTRIHNNANTSCYDTTSFFVEIFDSPIANPIADINICDDNNDGIWSFDFSTLDVQVLAEQNNAIFSVQYFTSLDDADNNQNAIIENYSNINSSQEIFVRIHNNANTNCYDISYFNIVINSAPEVFNSELYQCDADESLDGLALFNLSEANNNLMGGAENHTASFFLNLDDAQNNTNAINAQAFRNTANPQTIYVQVINNLTGCNNIAELSLIVTSTDANDASLSSCDNDGVEDGFYDFDLTAANATILNGLPNTANLKYFESYEDSLLEINELGSTFTNTTPYSQTIFARVENANACYGISQVTLTVFKLPNIETEVETYYCLNLFPETITLDSGILDDTSDNYKYLWSTGESTESIEVNTPGIYTVTLINANSCTKLRSITVLPSSLPTIENIEVKDVSTNNTITVFVSGNGEFEFSLDNSDGPYQKSNIFENVSPGAYTVYVRAIGGCGIISDMVSVIAFPKFFTPNDDSYHDTWQVDGINSPSLFESDIYIYDRYGKLLKQLNPKGPGWDGTMNGNKLPTNDYWFHVKLQDGRTFKSHFTLKR